VQGAQGNSGGPGPQGAQGGPGSPGAQGASGGVNTYVPYLGVNTVIGGPPGFIYATGDITAYYSDVRLKNILGKIVDALDKVNKLDGFYFEPNEVAQLLGYEKKVDVGLSAQVVKEILPEATAPAPVDPKYITVRYEKIIPLLVEAIKELDVKLEVIKQGMK
jgi:hypothetical protein